MSDDQRMVNIGGQLFGPAPEPPEHLRGVGGEVADAAWRQSHGSMAAYHALLSEHSRGVIDLTAENQTRLTPEDAPQTIGNGDARLTDTGGAVYGGTGPGSIQTTAPARPEPSGFTETLSADETARLEELRAIPPGERSAADNSELTALESRERA